MAFIKILCTVLIVVSACVLIESRSYNNGLIFYNLENHQTYLPPTISVSRGRGLSKFKYSPRGSIWSTFGKPCDCEGPLCACCVGIKVKQYNFDQKMCANISYVMRKDELQLEVFLNDTANAKYGISARDPYPLCIPIMMGIPMSMCIKMSNVGIEGDKLNMCMDFLVSLASTQIFEMHFQCMQMGLQGPSWVGPDGQPVLPPSEGKIKDRSDNESEEYYDDSEAEEENEIISKEQQMDKETELTDIKEEDLNKAEEEMDYNDIADKVMDIVKEQEQEEEEMKESSELMKENEIEGVSPMQNNNKVVTEDMEKIVTNIMESIKESNDMDDNDMITETAIELAADADEMENMESVTESTSNLNTSMIENEEKPLENEESTLEGSESVKNESVLNAPEISANEDIQQDLKESEELENEIKENELQQIKQDTTDLEETNEIIENHTTSQDIANNSIKDLFNLEDLNENSQEKEIDVDHITDTTQEIKDILNISNTVTEANHETNVTPAMEIQEEEFYQTTTEHMSNELETNNIEKFEMLINSDAVQTTETDKIDNELNNSLEILQEPLETSTEHLIAANLKPTVPQIAATTSETDNINNVDNTLTTATIMTTTTTTTTTSTTTKKPTIVSDENSVVAVTFIENTKDHDKTNHDNEGDDGKAENEDNENANGDSSHENDSDYDDEDDDEDDDEESEEIQDETTEQEIVTNDATTNIMPISTADLHKEFSTTERLTNALDTTESLTNNQLKEDENKNDDEDDDEEYEDESNEQKQKDDSEDEYYDEYEDYESTTVAIKDLETNSNNDTCCKSAATPSLPSNDTHATKIEQLDENTNNAAMQQNNTVSSDNLQFVSNSNTMISSDDSDMLNMESTTNKMSQITANPSATSTTSTTSSSTNIMPLPLARQLFVLQRQQQQQQQHQYQQYHRRLSRQRQLYV